MSGASHHFFSCLQNLRNSLSSDHMRLRKRIGKAGLGQGDLGGFGGFLQIGLDKKPLTSYFDEGVNWKYCRPKSSLNEQAFQTVFDEHSNFNGVTRLRLR